MNVLDRSNYFKGMLILAIKDNVIVEQEENILMYLGAKLGFEKKFCHNAIQQSLGNEYIIQTPPVFSQKNIAEQFLLDGLKLAVSDNNLDPYELQWLNSVAQVNKIEQEWLSNKLADFINTQNDNGSSPLLEGMLDSSNSFNSALDVNQHITK